MSTAEADLAKAINAAWDASALDATFKALWSDPTSTQFEVLNDQEAAPLQPFPYVVLEQSVDTTRARMTGDASEHREVRDVPIALRVHTRAISGDARSAKEIAAALADEVMKVFGGHPTVAAGGLTLDGGACLITQFQGGAPIRTGDDEYQWTLNYVCRLDVPVAV